ncbi:MAG: family 10 glycosylhydrolase [Candidatus Manganitrophus sp.]|nr:MAG: family 10 glycosylhydrolase [Candidatus Manganitrophus sp.]WDT75621.1 MAG: family 10 glycosylhydrolase [Candidatus Manganitrophus sp.]
MTGRAFSRRKFIKSTAAFAAGSLLKPWLALSSGVSLFESRAIFDEGLAWITKDLAEKLLTRIKKAGFNVFVPCVWHGRGTIWPSDLAPWDTRKVRVPGFDPLENLIKLAEKYEIEIHPWFTVSLRQRDFLPQLEFFEQRFKEGTSRQAFNIHSERFREFISSLIVEVATRYPVQGINLDYVRSGGMCKTNSCIEDYKRHTGRNLVKDWSLKNLPGVDLSALAAWQEGAVRDIISRISVGARKTRKNLVMSVDAVPGSSDTKLQGQDSMKWADEGLVDVVYSMDYQASPDFEKIRNLQSKMKRPEALVMLCGNYDRDDSGKKVIPRDARRAAEILSEARSISRGNGVGLYLYNMLSEEQIDLFQKTVFKAPAKPRWLRADPLQS